MNRLLVSIAALALISVPAFAQAPTPTCPPGYTYATVNTGLTACTPNAVPAPVVNQVQVPNRELQVAAPVVQAAVSAVTSASSITYLPKWYGSVGGGAVVPGSGKFAYESISVYLGAQTYATTAQEFTMSKGTVQSCTMAGISKIMYQFGLVSIGLTGLGGGCDSTAGSSGGAGAAQGFASFHLGKSGISIVLTGDKTFTTDGRQGAKITLGVSYGK